METKVTCRIQSCVNSVVVEGLMCQRCWEESTALTKVLTDKKLRSMLRNQEKVDYRMNSLTLFGFLFLTVVAVFGYLYNTGGK